MTSCVQGITNTNGDVAIALPSTFDAQDSHRYQAMLLALGRRMMARPPLGVLLQDASTLTAEVFGAELSSVSRLEADGEGLATTFTGQLNGSSVSKAISLPIEGSMVGYAVSNARMITSADLRKEDRFKDPALSQLGISSALAIPLHLHDHTFGALGVYSARARSFAENELSFAETLGHLLTLTLARFDAEASTTRQSQTLEALCEATSEIVMLLDDKGNVEQLNPTAQVITGYAGQELEGRPIWIALATTSEASSLKQAIEQARKIKRRVYHEGPMLRKDGQSRGLVWTIAAALDECDTVSGFVVTAREAGDASKSTADAPKQPLAAELKTQSTPPTAGHANSIRQPRPAKLWNGQPDQSAEGAPTGRDKRLSPRREYTWTQMIALRDGDRSPRADQFFAVQCRDISAGGLSFILDSQPQYKHIVVELGTAPHTIHMGAEIVRVVPTKEDGEPRYLIGCRFSGRMER